MSAGGVPPAVEHLRDALLRALPWTPHDYVDGISVQGDRELHVASLLRALPPEDDLRFVHGDAAAGTVVLAEVLPWDSEFFGYGVARLHAAFDVGGPLGDARAELAPAIAELVARARRRGARYLFAQVDPRDLALQRALGECGFSLIETRVHQHRSLRDFSATERFAIRRAVAADLDGLERTAAGMVNPYDRFHSDPFIARADADRLLARWVRASTVGGFADATFVPDDPRPLAFCTTKLHAGSWRSWGVRLVQPVVLGAVAPEFKGWYRKLISEICVRLAADGAEHAFFVTQLANPAALRAVERLGFRIGRGELVFRKLLEA